MSIVYHYPMYTSKHIQYIMYLLGYKTNAKYEQMYKKKHIPIRIKKKYTKQYL